MTFTQELTPEQKQQLEDAQPILEALTEGEAHQDMGADIPALINDMIEPVPDYAPPVGPAVRVVNRAAKMSLMMRMKDFDTKLVEKCGYKSVEIFSALGTVIGIGLARIIHRSFRSRGFCARKRFHICQGKWVRCAGFPALAFEFVGFSFGVTGRCAA